MITTIFEFIKSYVSIIDVIDIAFINSASFKRNKSYIYVSINYDTFSASWSF